MAYDGSIISTGTSPLACQSEVCQPQLGLGFAIVFGDAGRGSKRTRQRCVANCPVEHARAWWFWGHPVLVAVVSSAVVGAVATLLCIPVLMVSIHVDVVSCVVSPLVIDEVVSDRRSFPSPRGWLLMD